MPLNFTDHFSGWSGQTCSYTTDFITKHAEAAKLNGMTEANYRKHLVESHWGFMKAEIAEGNIKDGAILLRGKNTFNDKEMRVTWDANHGQLKMTFPKNPEIEPGWDSIEGFEQYSLNSGAWDWTVPTHRPSPVGYGSHSTGALTDEDAAALFVHTKDKFAKEKGINIKGVNPQLDLEVYEALAKQLGYTAKELAAKVEQYKSLGNKLSALKKKVLKDPSIVEKALLKKKNNHPEVPKPPPPQVHEGNVIWEMPEPKTNMPDVSDLAPTTKVVDDAVKELIDQDKKHTLLYADEDVVKAYIRAKDQLASKADNPFTLYTKSDEFDEAIYHLMSKSYGVDLTGPEIKKHIANYLGGGNKISVLKKKMIKNGELSPEAPTLKKTKAEKQFDTAPTTSLKEAQDQIDAFAKAAADPVGTQGYKFNSASETSIFNDLKGSIYAKMDDSSAWAKFEEIAVKYRKLNSNDNISTLDIIRVYDRFKAKQLGIDNGHFYEKKVGEWASTPAGKQHIIQQKANIEAQAKIKAEQAKAAEAKKIQEEAAAKAINEGVPDLPEDSVLYQEISTTKARQMQDAADPWNATQKNGLTHYTGGSYTPMNQFLRGSTDYVNTTNKAAINAAQDGMRPTTEPFLVKRGAGYQSFGIGTEGKYGFDIGDHSKFKAMIGKEVEEKGFLSTSVGGEGAFGGSVQIEIEVAPGTYGAYVDHISQHRGEREFMIAHGTKYKLIRVTAKTGYGGSLSQTVVRLRTIPGSHSRKRI